MKRLMKRIWRAIPILACLLLFALPSAAQSMYFTSSSIAFGSVPAGTTLVRTLTLNSNGAIPLIILAKNMAGSSAYSETDNCASPIAVGQSCTFTVTFAPASAGFAGGTLTVVTNAVPANSVATFTGTGVGLSLGQTCVGTSTGGAGVPIFCPSIGAGDQLAVVVKAFGNSPTSSSLPLNVAVNDSQSGTYAPAGQPPICSSVAGFCVFQFIRVTTAAAGNLNVSVAIQNGTAGTNNEAWLFDVAGSNGVVDTVPQALQGLNGPQLSSNPGDFIIGFNVASNCDVNSTSASSGYTLISKPTGSCYISGEYQSILTAGLQQPGFTGTTDLSFTGLFDFEGAVKAYFVNVCGQFQNGIAGCQNFVVGSMTVVMNPPVSVTITGKLASGGTGTVIVPLGTLTTN